MPDPDHPFDLQRLDDFLRWRERKLRDYPERLEQLVIEIDDPHRLREDEYRALHALCKKTNMAIWSGLSGHDADKSLIRDLGRQFGLQRLDDHLCADEDAISSLTIHQDALHQGYIPYTDRPIAWHTDGYYNPLDHQIHGMLLHCVQPADEGGENDLLDPEIVYLLIRDENPTYIRALMHPRAMTIPANVVDGQTLRPARTGPVFSVGNDGRLHMRYTDRSRSIEWRQDALLEEAVAYLKHTLRTPSPWHFHGKLQAGQGLICNNVLHTRSGFQDHRHRRLLYRARYFDRISQT